MRDSITLCEKKVKEVGDDHAYPDYLTVEVFGNEFGISASGVQMQLLSKNGSAYHTWRISPEMALALRDFINKHTDIIEHRVVTRRTAYFK